MKIIDADGLVLGRLASYVAKELLEGDKITIVNADKAIVTGSKVTTFKEYRDMREKGSREKGPYFPKRPDRILKRTIRGMLPYKRSRGRKAFSNLRVYVGAPDEYEGAEFSTIDDVKIVRQDSSKGISLGDLSARL